MNLQKIYTALLTADLAAAKGWYTKLLGRGPDHRPMDTLVQWELFDQGGLMLSSSNEIAGKGVMFLYVDDLTAERRRLQGLGIALGDDIPGDYSTLAQLRDPDGNLITLATPPAGPSRRHDRAGRAKRGVGQHAADGACVPPLMLTVSRKIELDSPSIQFAAASK